MRPLGKPSPEATGPGYFISPQLLRAGRGEPIAHHVTMRLADSRVLAPSGAQRRIAARALLDAGRGHGLLAFHVVDTHAHLLAACPRAEAGELARRVEISLRARLGLGCPFDPARIRPVADQWHLQRSILYILHQDDHHGVDADPARDGSSLPDVLGWRVVDPELAARVRALAPRVKVAAPLDREALLSVEVEPELLAEAAAAALGLPTLEGRRSSSTAGRRAAVHVARAEHACRISP